VPWLEGYTLPGRGASSTRQQVQVQVPYEEDSEELVLPRFSIAEPPTVSTSARSSSCRFTASASGCGSDDARPKKRKWTRVRARTRMETRAGAGAGTGVDVVKINRLDVRTLILT
jgi:hypothetical protein